MSGRAITIRKYEDELSLQHDRARRHTRTLEVIAKYASGIPVEDICDTYTISRNQVLRIARLAGLPKRPKHFPIELRNNVLAALRAGMALKEINRIFEVSEAYASKLAKENGLARYKRAGVPVVEVG